MPRATNAGSVPERLHALDAVRAFALLLGIVLAVLIVAGARALGLAAA